MEILFINNYPMDHAWELWQKREYPGHHLWGANELNQFGIRVHIPRHEVSSTINKLGEKWLDVQFLDQQLRVAALSKKYDVIYSGCQSNSLILAVLRKSGFVRTPLISIVHHPIAIGSRGRAFVSGHDKLICLSRRIMQQIETDFPESAQKLIHLDWGPEIDFYRRDAQLDSSPWCDVVSAGKSNRDHSTLAVALADTKYRLKIFCSSESAPKAGTGGANTQVFCGSKHQNAIDYSQLVNEYRHSTIVAIPLTDTNALAGLTSLLDAMVMGKPVVMTKNKNLDINIEQENIGIWVEPGDVAGWRRAIQFLMDNPEEAMCMGRRARGLVERRYNSSTFSRGLAISLISAASAK